MNNLKNGIALFSLDMILLLMITIINYCNYSCYHCWDYLYFFDNHSAVNYRLKQNINPVLIKLHIIFQCLLLLFINSANCVRLIFLFKNSSYGAHKFRKQYVNFRVLNQVLLKICERKLCLTQLNLPRNHCRVRRFKLNYI